METTVFKAQKEVDGNKISSPNHKIIIILLKLKACLQQQEQEQQSNMKQWMTIENKHQKGVPCVGWGNHGPDDLKMVLKNCKV